MADYSGKPTFLGPKIKPGALKDKYNNVSAEKFGTTVVQIVGDDGTVREYEVRDMHYVLKNGAVGMYVIPTRDNACVRDPETGQRLAGHALLDAFLRSEMSLSPDDQIFALGCFI